MIRELVNNKFHNFFGLIFLAKSPLIKKLISDGSNKYIASIEHAQDCTRFNVEILPTNLIT